MDTYCSYNIEYIKNLWIHLVYSLYTRWIQRFLIANLQNNRKNDLLISRGRARISCMLSRIEFLSKSTSDYRHPIVNRSPLDWNLTSLAWIVLKLGTTMIVQSLYFWTTDLLFSTLEKGKNPAMFWSCL